MNDLAVAGASAKPPSLLPFVVMCCGMFIALLDIQIVASSLQDIGGGLSAVAYRRRATKSVGCRPPI